MRSESNMNKSELVAAVAAHADIPKTEAAQVVDGFVKTVTEALVKGETVNLVGFGSFLIKERAARVGRNPQNGAEIQIPASKVPSFKAGKLLKEAVSG